MFWEILDFIVIIGWCWIAYLFIWAYRNKQPLGLYMTACGIFGSVTVVVNTLASFLTYLYK